MISSLLLLSILNILANWRLFQKMGRQGWESLIPFYNHYILFENLYGCGAKMFLMLIPFYGIYVAIKYYIDLARAFNKSLLFGLGLIFLNSIFFCILGLGSAEYLDGSHAAVGRDGISRFVENLASSTEKTAQDSAVDLLRELTQLHANGAITDEEFQEKKNDLLTQI